MKWQETDKIGLEIIPTLYALLPVLSSPFPQRDMQSVSQLFWQVETSQKEFSNAKKKFRFKNKLISFDATFIELCASLFDWAIFRKTKGAVKLHLLLG